MKIIRSTLIISLAISLCSCTERSGRQMMTDVAPNPAVSAAGEVREEWKHTPKASLHIRIDAERAVSILSDITMQFGHGGPQVHEQADWRFTHPYEHDFVLSPYDAPTEVLVTARINGDDYSTRTVIPYLQDDTRTWLNFYYERGHLRLASSWIEEHPQNVATSSDARAEVHTGDFLYADGSIHADYDTAAVALVYETDGKHGRAVALHDVPGLFCFSESGASSGRIFATLDGFKSEGKIAVSSDSADISEPTVSTLRPFSYRYPDSVAFGHSDGFLLCDSLMHAMQDNPTPYDMMTLCVRSRAVYVPTIAELLACQRWLGANTSASLGLTYISALSGVYLTCCESSPSTCYVVDADRGCITGTCSKRYVRAKVRPFYLF